MDELKNIKVSIQEKNEIKKDSPDTLPLNPTAHGFSGAEIRRKLSKSITGEKGSVLSLLSDKMNIISDLFYIIFDEKGLVKDGFLPDEETITLNNDDELEATNVAIWRYE